MTSEPEAASDGVASSSSDTIAARTTMRTASPAGDDSPQPRRDPLIVAVELSKALAWPLLALTFFVMFYGPIRRTITVIPDKLEKSARGNVWSFSWEISENARQVGGNSLALLIGNLSPTAIDSLINVPRYGSAVILSGYGGPNQENGYVFPPHLRLDSFAELEAAQLVTFREPLQPWLRFLDTLPLVENTSISVPYGRVMLLTQPLTPDQQRRADWQSYELTAKGQQAVDAIVRAIREQLQPTDRPR